MILWGKKIIILSPWLIPIAELPQSCVPQQHSDEKNSKVSMETLS